jgi:hypothetical protein
MPLDHAGKTKAGSYPFRPLSEKERKEFTQRGKEVRTYQKERQSREAQRQNILEEKASKKPDTNKENFSRSPIMDRPNQKADRKNPPALFQTPKPNLHVEPLQREHDSSHQWSRSQRSEERGQRSEVRGQRSIDNVQKSGNRGGLPEDRMRRSHNGQERE